MVLTVVFCELPDEELAGASALEVVGAPLVDLDCMASVVAGIVGVSGTSVVEKVGMECCPLEAENEVSFAVAVASTVEELVVVVDADCSVVTLIILED